MLYVNDPKLAHFTYERFLLKQIREEHEYLGTPIRSGLKSKKTKRLIKLEFVVEENYPQFEEEIKQHHKLNGFQELLNMPRYFYWRLLFIS